MIAKVYPQAEALKQAIYDIFRAKTKRAARRRYERGLALHEAYVSANPERARLFAFLTRHWPTLLNGIESQRIQGTNNAVEGVIRRFDQLHQNSCALRAWRPPTFIWPLQAPVPTTPNASARSVAAARARCYNPTAFPGGQWASPLAFYRVVRHVARKSTTIYPDMRGR